METDRELLELAAKAAGREIGREDQGDPIDRKFSDCLGLWCVGPWPGWFNPLNDDGDALRLAARLELDVMHRVVGGRRIEALAAGGLLVKYKYQGDIAAAMRRAIVLAAADIGRKMP